MKFFVKRSLLNGNYSVTDGEAVLYNVSMKTKNMVKTFMFTDTDGNEAGTVQRKLSLSKKSCDIIIGGEQKGILKMVRSFTAPSFEMDGTGWTINGNIIGYDFKVMENDYCIIEISREAVSLTDSYLVNAANDDDLLIGAMITVAVNSCYMDKL